MVVCSAYGCSNRSDPRYKSKRQKLEEITKKITFHSFPKRHEQRTKWIAAIRRKDWEPRSDSKLCSEHFAEECFDRTSLFCVRLRENSIPTIFPAFPSYLQKKKSHFEQNRKDGRRKLKQNAISNLPKMVNPPARKSISKKYKTNEIGPNLKIVDSQIDYLQNLNGDIEETSYLNPGSALIQNVPLQQPEMCLECQKTKVLLKNINEEISKKCNQYMMENQQLREN